MQNCNNDFTPIILAVATVISVQIPIIVAFLMNQFKTIRDARTLKEVAFTTKQKVDELTLITTNGFHGPAGPPGPPGEPGKDAKIIFQEVTGNTENPTS